MTELLNFYNQGLFSFIANNFPLSPCLTESKLTLAPSQLVLRAQGDPVLLEVLRNRAP